MGGVITPPFVLWPDVCKMMNFCTRKLTKFQFVLLYRQPMSAWDFVLATAACGFMQTVANWEDTQ